MQTKTRYAILTHYYRRDDIHISGMYNTYAHADAIATDPLAEDIDDVYYREIAVFQIVEE